MTDVVIPPPVALPNRPAVGPDASLLDRLLADQHDLTAVERFSQLHARAHGEVWTDLIPLSRPRPGEQYRFSVDLDACTGCKACVTACHSRNGLDDGESFRTVGLLHGADADGLAFSQTVTTACHHCVEPACMLGCPTLAYEKDPATGIVRHLDDQCIGCSYCTLTCPYEVPRFNERLGIVRKCDLCHDRLADGEAPACVQGCPTNAISVGIVTVADVLAAAGTIDLPPTDAGSHPAPTRHTTHDSWGEPALVPTAPPSRLTHPTTVYLRHRPFAGTAGIVGTAVTAVPAAVAGIAGTAIAGRANAAAAVAADRHQASPAHAHTPLAVMLVLTQLAAGLAVAGVLMPVVAGATDAARATLDTLHTALAVAALAAGALALGASLLHLGRPTKAWKAVLGLRTSWLSREILAFGLFAASATAWSAGRLLGLPGGIVTSVAAVTASCAVTGVLCSALIYAVTGRRWWWARRTVPKFLGTTAGLGAAAVVPVVALAAARGADATRTDLLTGLARPAALLALIVLAVKLAAELLLVLHPHRSGQLERTAHLLRHDLAGVWQLRLAAGVGAVVLSGIVAGVAADPAADALAVAALGTFALAAATMGELFERWLFFTASSPRRMPGMPR